MVGLASNGVDPVDGGVALWRDGRFLFALPEERVTRRKYAGGFRASMHRVLQLASIGLSDVDAFAFASYGESQPGSVDHIVVQAPELAAHASRIRLCPSHHFAHAIAAARFAPWDDALVVVMDNEGMILGPQLRPTVNRNPMERVSFYVAGATSVDLLTRDLYGKDDVSIGEAYRRFSYYCGFASHQLAGKTMALAALGSPSALGSTDVVTSDGGPLQVRLGASDDEPAASVERFFRDQGLKIEPARQAGGEIHPDHRNAAAFIQKQIEVAIANRLRRLLECTGQQSISFSGGVAYNCRLIGALENELEVPVFVPPSPGDQGLAIGAVLAVLERDFDIRARHEPTSRLGGAYSLDSERSSSASAGMACAEIRGSRSQLVAHTVRRLREGAIVGLFEGQSEVGRRALGGRSLICLPEAGAMDRLRVLKAREEFRPFGASIAEAEALKTFDPARQPDRFMLRAHVTTSTHFNTVAHVDGTLRAQLVMKDEDSFLREVLDFLAHSGYPALVVNTSMNLAGEPLVEDADDAIGLFKSSQALDLLVFADDQVVLDRLQGRAA